MRLKYQFVIQQTSGDFVAIAIGNDVERFNGILRFNEIGKSIFEQLQKGNDEKGIIDALQQEYEGSVEEMRNEVKNFINQLIQAELLDA